MSTTLISDDHLYSDDLVYYWDRPADQQGSGQQGWPFFYAFPELCRDLQGNAVGVAVFRRREVPRVTLVGAVGARDVTGFQLSLAEMVTPARRSRAPRCVPYRGAGPACRLVLSAGVP